MSNAFAPIVRARPCPIFGRPVHRRGRPLDYSPILLLRLFGFRIAPDTLSSTGLRRRPARHYPCLWIQRPSSERWRDFNPLTHALPSTHYEGATTSRSRNLGRLLVRFRAPRDPSSVRARHIALPDRWRTDPGLGTCLADCPKCWLALTWT